MPLMLSLSALNERFAMAIAVGLRSKISAHQRPISASSSSGGTTLLISPIASAFKPYPCGTMAHPYIDCARRLAARGIKPTDVKEMICEVAEGTVHRLWEPLAAKQRPPNGYAAKFATPFILASGFVRGGVGLDAFTDDAVHDAQVLALAAKVRYVINPDNPYPNGFTGHIRAVLNDGQVVEERH